MIPRPRLLPTVMVAASALLALKSIDLWNGGSAAISAAHAETTPATPPAAPGTPAGPAPAATPPTPTPDAAPATPPAPQAAAPAPQPAPGAAPARPSPAQAAAKQQRDPLQMTPEEIDELQQLSARRVELDRRAAELSEREVLMQAAEKRIDEKIGKLQSLQKSIESDVKQKNDEENTRVQSLAHMYEQMKPADAARILGQLDVPVLLTVLDNIREQKAAPILAAMDPAKAKAVTLALAEKKNPQTAPPPGGQN
jgi:flagellar motility protein MotE (MotC chaperone)